MNFLLLPLLFILGCTTGKDSKSFKKELESLSETPTAVNSEAPTMLLKKFEVVPQPETLPLKKIKDEPMLMAVLAYYPAPGILFERHRLGVKDVFNHDPAFVLKVTNKLFNNNTDCLIYKLLPPTEQISYGEVRPALTDSITKLGKEKNANDLKLVQDFRDKADAYYKALKNKSAKLNTASCQQVSAKNLKAIE